MKHWLPWLRRNLICRWLHRRDRCYPEVWDRGPDGPWHCARCVPCDSDILW